jgi:S1-C subfamily serine protease
VGPIREPVVLVTRVEPGSIAFRTGLRAGDAIIGVNRRRTGSVNELSVLLRGTDRALLNVLRGDTLLTIALR